MLLSNVAYVSLNVSVCSIGCNLYVIFQTFSKPILVHGTKRFTGFCITFVNIHKIQKNSRHPAVEFYQFP